MKKKLIIGIALVTNVIQDGTCTISVNKGSLHVAKTVLAQSDATTTQCETATFKRSDFSEAGSWSVNVLYTASNVTGEANSTLTIR
jgi:hypothetical protein